MMRAFTATRFLTPGVGLIGCVFVLAACTRPGEQRAMAELAVGFDRHFLVVTIDPANGSIDNVEVHRVANR